MKFIGNNEIIRTVAKNHHTRFDSGRQRITDEVKKKKVGDSERSRFGRSLSLKEVSILPALSKFHAVINPFGTPIKTPFKRHFFLFFCGKNLSFGDIKTANPAVSCNLNLSVKCARFLVK